MPTYLTPGVYVEEVEAGPKPLAAAATAVAAFIGFTAKAPTDDPDDPEGAKPRLVTSWGQYESFYGGFVEGAMLPHSVYGYFLNGGSSAYISRIPHREPAEEPPMLALPAKGDEETPALEFTATAEDADVEVKVEPGPSTVEGSFNVTVNVGGAPVETFEGLTFDSAESEINEASSYVKVEVKADASVEAPAMGRFPLAAPTPPAKTITTADFNGDENARTGIRGLVIAEDATMLACPDLITAATTEDGSVDLDMWKAVQTALINHCEGQANRVAVLDSPPGMSPQQVKEWRSDVAMYDSKFAAFYYPWIEVDNPLATNGNKTLMVPPSGHMAGIWARTDESRGVWKAPANEVVRGALNVGYKMTKAEQGILNPIGINAIRPFGTRGIRVWGARTLSSDPSWVYINVRRLFNMIETSIMDGTQWVVFEPNDQTLWERVKRTIRGFLLGLWREGALFGTTADEAFFVKCDAETNPPESIDLGRLVVEIGIAPVKPAEFVIFRISQIAKGGE